MNKCMLHSKVVISIFLLCTSMMVHSKSEALNPQIFDCVMIPSMVLGVSTGEPGVLETVLVERSARVKKGQLLAKLESSVEKVDRDLAKAQSEMNAVIKLRQVSMDFDGKNLERISSLHKKNMVSIDAKEKAQRETELAQLRLEDAQDLVRQRKLKLLRSEAVLKRRKIYSPVDGIVLERLHHPGEFVEEQPIVKIAQLNPIFVEVVLPLSAFGLVQKGMTATVMPELSENKKHKATVKLIDGIGDAASGTFGVRLSLPNPNYDIPVGVKCSLSFDDLTLKSTHDESFRDFD